MKKILLVFLLISTIFAYDGNWLYQKGLEDKKIDRGLRGSYYDSALYRAYVSGVVDSWVGSLFCPSSNATNGQAFDIVFKYLEEHPEKRDTVAVLLIVNALQKVWPCHHKLKVEDVISKLYELEKYVKTCKEKKSDMFCYLLAKEYDNFDKETLSIPIYKTLCKKERNNTRGSPSCYVLKEKAETSYILYKNKVANYSYYFEKAKDLYSYSCKYNNLGCKEYVELLVVSGNKNDIRKAKKIEKRICSKKYQGYPIWNDCIDIRKILSKRNKK